jgi:5-methylthioadenosine/S-adenosylhomocysteine deaminase
MQTVDLRIDPRWLVPIEPVEALTGHALIVDGDRIVASLPVADADLEYEPRIHLSLSSHVLMPGLVNAHTHAAMALFRGIADDVPLSVWLEQHIWPRERAFVAPDFVHEGSLLAAAEMLKGGITCCNDMYFFPDATARAFVEAGMRAMLGIVVLDFPSAYASDADGYLQAGLAIRDQYRHQSRISFSLAPHAPYTVSDTAWEKIVMYARQLDLPIQTHLAETASEVAESRERYHMTPLERLHSLGATGPGLIAIHAVHLEPGDIDLLVTHGGHVIHCPTSNMKLASGIAPVAKLVSRGINVGLGSDSAASNNRLDLFGEMHLAALLAKVVTADPAVLPAHEVLRMATLDGARALGQEEQIGSLVAGKQADMIAVDMSGLNAAPCFDPLSHLVHAVGRSSVTDVWIGGERIVDDGVLTSIDESAINARARVWQERLT